ncbi:MAG: MFS transporter [Cyclobacteriaceae bacterium]|jgi:ACS family glucarate transporter-like MFS transporter
MNKKYWILALLSLLSVITFLDRNAISIAGVRITQELGLSESQFGWILTAFTLSYGLLEIPMGLWGDRFGEKRVIIRIVFWWSLFTALTGLVTGFASLFLVRFLFGAGEAGAYPNTAISIRKWFPVVERGRAQSFIWMASRIGGAIAPFIVVPLQMEFGWRMTFYFLGAIGLVWVLAWWLLYPTTSPVVEETKKSETLSWKVYLTDRNFWFLLIMYYCYACGVFFFISWLPKYLQNGRGISESELAYSASLPFLLAAFGCWLGGFVSDWLVTKIGINWGRKIVPVVGLSLSGLVMLIALFTKDNSVAIVFLALGLAFMDVTAPVAWAVATDIGGKSSGAITGAMNTAGLLGGTAASLGIGYLVAWKGNYDLPVIILAVQLLIGALFAGLLRVSNAKE